MAIPGDGSMMQDPEQHQHQTQLGCNQVHEQYCWTLQSADLLLCSSILGLHTVLTSMASLSSAISSQEDFN